MTGTRDSGSSIRLQFRNSGKLDGVSYSNDILVIFPHGVDKLGTCPAPLTLYVLDTSNVPKYLLSLEAARTSHRPISEKFLYA